MIKQYDPKNGDDDKRIISRLEEAKDTLLNPKKREAYDSKKENLEGTILGNYRIIEKIAEGGFGTTYKGEHLLSKTEVCIKHGHRISPQDEEILLKEIKIIDKMRHFGIPSYKDTIKLDDGSLAIVMSYIPGTTLEKIIEKTGGLDVEHVCWITERTLNILKYLHFNGVVHVDVKPQNIIIQPEDHTVVLVDYGLSSIHPKSDSKSEGHTPYFASPEQISGLPLIPESDFYGLAMTMIYALGGDIKTKHVPEDTPEPICDFLRKMLIRDPINRPNWQKEDLSETISGLRMKLFKRRSSNMKKIPGL